MQQLIPRETVIELCQEIVQRHKQTWLRFISIGYWQCWGCQKFGNKDGSFSNICALNSENNRGCTQVNNIYEG